MGEKEFLFDLRNGNVCSLCETSVSWMFDARNKDNAAIPYTTERALCKKCWEYLKEKVK